MARLPAGNIDRRKRTCADEEHLHSEPGEGIYDAAGINNL
jgi:hypothetical protein